MGVSSKSTNKLRLVTRDREKGKEWRNIQSQIASLKLIPPSKHVQIKN